MRHTEGVRTCLLLLALAPQQSVHTMIADQLQSRGINDPKLLQVVRKTPRHLFVPPYLEAQAYGDHPLPIGKGQTISQPYIVALMTQLLDPKPDSRVLEIGAGSGYQAAILSQLAQHVYTMEIVPELAANSKDLLKRLGYNNVTVRLGDGYKGWPEQAPFDRVILTAAPPELPQALIDQLKPGGRLVAPVGTASQELIVIEKQKDGKLKRRTSIPVMFVPMVPSKQ